MRLINVVGSKSWLPVVGLRERASPSQLHHFLRLLCSSKDSKVERGGTDLSEGLLLQKIIADLAGARQPPPTSSFLTLACSSKDSEVERGICQNENRPSHLQQRM